MTLRANSVRPGVSGKPGVLGRRVACIDSAGRVAIADDMEGVASRISEGVLVWLAL